MGDRMHAEAWFSPPNFRPARQRRRAAAQFINTVERTASQPTGSQVTATLLGGWLAVAHFYRSATQSEVRNI